MSKYIFSNEMDSLMSEAIGDDGYNDFSDELKYKMAAEFDNLDEHKQMLFLDWCLFLSQRFERKQLESARRKHKFNTDLGESSIFSKNKEDK